MASTCLLHYYWLTFCQRLPEAQKEMKKKEEDMKKAELLALIGAQESGFIPQNIF